MTGTFISEDTAHVFDDDGPLALFFSKPSETAPGRVVKMRCNLSAAETFLGHGRCLFGCKNV